VVPISLGNKKIKIATHYCLRINPNANHLHDKCLGCVQQFGESQIVVTEQMIVLIYILAKDGLYAWISLDCQAALAAHLL
jgi:hypothetical protein